MSEGTLRRADDGEGLAQVALVEGAELGRRDEIVGLAPGSHLSGLMADPNVGDELEGISQVVTPFGTCLLYTSRCV